MPYHQPGGPTDGKTMCKTIRHSIAITLFCCCINSHSHATDYYVRTDGGTAAQCNGLADAPFPGLGTGQSCAWAHPFWALNAGDPPTWKLQGGDTLIIRSAVAGYELGISAPNTSWCDIGYPWDCVLPALPSGPDAQHPTRILGYGWNQGCVDPPELWGAERPLHLLSLIGTSHAVIACLELTDHSACVESHSNPAVECKRDSYPYGDWAPVGIVASDSTNVRLQNLDIHGLAHTGVHAGRITDWSVQDVRIAGNGWCGWDGDIGNNSSNSDTLTFRRWIVEWNGCAETYPGKQPDHCWDQTHGGYGDGVGTGATRGHWIIEDSVFRYNTSDGLDLLYVRENPSLIELRRTRAYGNAGNPIKIAGPAKIENCLIVGDCGYFSGKPYAQEMSDHCRAGGNSLALSFGQGDDVTVVNSTIVGQGDCLVEAVCDRGNLPCDGSESATFLNNIFRGYKEFLDPQDTACLIWEDPSGISTGHMDYNLIYNAKNSGCPRGTNDLCANPLFVSDNLSSFDGHLQPASLAIDSGLAVGGLTPDHDLENRPRPFGPQVDRGAFEYRSLQPGKPVTSPYLLLLD
ncbi:MAG: choice-of-anchor Q domain-containing protein [Desulforhabdus sp.]|nr:choice-of-anchor Q domain-containing protein [Desulforhabdus sp.]